MTTNDLIAQYTYQLNKNIQWYLQNLNWPKWATHYCHTCDQYSVPNNYSTGGEDNFGAVINLANPISSFITSSVACALLNGATRTEKKNYLFCPYCKKNTVINKEEYVLENELSLREKEFLDILKQIDKLETLNSEKEELTYSFTKNAFVLPFFMLITAPLLGVLISFFVGKTESWCFAIAFCCFVVYFFIFNYHSKKSDIEKIIYSLNKTIKRQFKEFSIKRIL